MRTFVAIWGVLFLATTATMFNSIDPIELVQYYGPVCGWVMTPSGPYWRCTPQPQFEQPWHPRRDYDYPYFHYRRHPDQRW